jgi:hypothetical protein
MWGSILRYAAKGAIALGLHTKALKWLRGKLEKVEDKAIDQLKDVNDTIDKLYEATDGPMPTLVVDDDE